MAYSEPSKKRSNTALSLGSVHLVSFSDLLANGQGVGRVEGMVVFVDGALPDEQARVRITLVKKSYAQGEVVELVRRSDARTTPFCPVFGVCGGCQVQHLVYPSQLEWKTQIVRSALERIGAFTDVRVAPTVGMNVPRAYRNKMSLVVRNRPGAPSEFGFYQARTHELVPIAGCPIVLPQLDRTIAGLEAAAADPATAPAFAGVKHAITRAGLASGESVLSLTTEAPSAAVKAAAPALAQRLPGAVGISNSFAPASSNAVMGRKVLHAWGRPEMEERIGGARYRISAASFFQVNSEMVGRIFDLLAPGLAEPRKIVDLYCGAGTFSIFFALHGATVTGVEENPAAVREGNANVALNGVAERVRFLQGRVEAVLARPEGRTALREADIAFLDPPRKGTDEHTLDAIAGAGVRNVWYLSCNPATLARDLAHLRAAGYELGLVQPFDMFPQTGHVETLVTMSRADAPVTDLQLREAAFADAPVPVWPDDAPFAQRSVPDFVER